MHPPFETLVANALNARILDSAARNLDHGQDSPITTRILAKKIALCKSVTKCKGQRVQGPEQRLKVQRTLRRHLRAKPKDRRRRRGGGRASGSPSTTDRHRSRGTTRTGGRTDPAELNQKSRQPCRFCQLGAGAPGCYPRACQRLCRLTSRSKDREMYDRRADGFY